MNLAIVGYRYYDHYEQFCAVVQHQIEVWGQQPDLIVSGGATGADTLAQDWADENGIEIKVFSVEPEDWKEFGRKAGHLRNQKIVDLATHMIAFPSYSKSIGTFDSIRKAKKKGIPLWVEPI